MEAFATVDQYETRFGPVADADLLSECLDDASAAIRMALVEAGVSWEDPSEDFADRLMRVCRSMANRLMPAEGSAVPQGVTQMGMTAGSYSEQYTFHTSYGTAKPLPSELDLLGIGGSVGRVLTPAYATGGAS